MVWSEEAREAISKVPFFVRKRVKRKVEEEAVQTGADSVTMEHVRSSQRKFLNRMEDEVKGYQIETCFGPGGCSNRAVVDDKLIKTIEDKISKRDLKSFFKSRVNGPLKIHHEFRISVSDCPNACSRPQIADIGLLGACVPEIGDGECTQCEACIEACREEAISLSEQGPKIDPGKCLYCGQCIKVCPSGSLNKKTSGYRIQVGGKLGRRPRLAVELPRVYDPGETVIVIDRCLDYYQEHCQKGERFGEVLSQKGMKDLEGRLS
jgi:anaerobic sulfite reductase subunit C